MSLPEEDLPIANFVQEEMIDCMSELVFNLLGQMPPPVRLKLLAFMHLATNPETMSAALEVDPNGYLSLSLETHVTPCRSHQH